MLFKKKKEDNIDLIEEFKIDETVEISPEVQQVKDEYVKLQDALKSHDSEALKTSHYIILDLTSDFEDEQSEELEIAVDMEEYVSTLMDVAGLLDVEKKLDKLIEDNNMVSFEELEKAIDECIDLGLTKESLLKFYPDLELIYSEVIDINDYLDKEETVDEVKSDLEDIEEDTKDEDLKVTEESLTEEAESEETEDEFEEELEVAEEKSMDEFVDCNKQSLNTSELESSEEDFVEEEMFTEPELDLEKDEEETIEAAKEDKPKKKIKKTELIVINVEEDKEKKKEEMKSMLIGIAVIASAIWLILKLFKRKK